MYEKLVCVLLIHSSSMLLFFLSHQIDRFPRNYLRFSPFHHHHPPPARPPFTPADFRSLVRSGTWSRRLWSTSSGPSSPRCPPRLSCRTARASAGPTTEASCTRGEFFFLFRVAELRLNAKKCFIPAFGWFGAFFFFLVCVAVGSVPSFLVTLGAGSL